LSILKQCGDRLFHQTKKRVLKTSSSWRSDLGWNFDRSENAKPEESSIAGIMMKFFNTAGPVNSRKHYCLQPLERFDFTEITSLIEQEKYFVLHAPRQTGKTSCLLALMERLNAEGKYKCLYINVEAAQGAREDVRRGVKAILSEMASRAHHFLDDSFLKSVWLKVLEESGEDAGLNEALTLWAEENQSHIVLLIDEIDSLIGDTLISVLRQIRSGYDKRPHAFPQTIILCGVRDVRDYRIHSTRDKAIITGGSAFNIKAKSLRLGNFNKEEIRTLYLQHSEETGQVFEPDTLELAWDMTKGQPWLVNALAYEVCFEMKDGRNRADHITVEMMETAKENIILRKDTHIDQLADKLKEERVKRIISPMLQGIDLEVAVEDDIQYTLDLGLIRRTQVGLQIANSIYREVIPRYLTIIPQYNFESRVIPSWYINEDTGLLEMDKLLSAFQEFFRENSEHWVERFEYKEAGPQLLLQAFLQRIVNRSGRVEREYGLGRMRTDLLVIRPTDTVVQKIVIELKILYKSLEKTIEDGLKQTVSYMDKCGSDEGHLIIFDRDVSRSWDEKIFKRKQGWNGKEVVVWGM